MKDEKMLTSLLIVAIGSGVSQSQAGRIAQGKDKKIAVVALGAAASAALAHMITPRIYKIEKLEPFGYGMSANEKLIIDIASSALFAALASYVAESSQLSSMGKSLAVAAAAPLGVYVGRRVSRHFLRSGPLQPTKPACQHCPDGFKLDKGMCAPEQGGGLLIDAIPGCPGGQMCVDRSCVPIVQ